MADELKPCPFCGGEAIMAIAHGGNPYIACAGECSVVLDGETEAEAVAAWNTRHERTCRNTAAMKDRAFTCSECWTYYSFNRRNSLSDVMLCPHCGARVVE